MKDDNIFKPASNIVENSHVDEATYNRMYRESVNSPETFWNNHGKRIDWIKPYSKVSDVSYKKDDVHIKWYEDGTLNASFNCLDRHLKTKGERTAIIWEVMILVNLNTLPIINFIKMFVNFQTFLKK